MLHALAFSALLASVALAEDYRLQITKPDGLSMQLFETAFFAGCDGFPWARNPNNSYSDPHALFEPGDYQGKNNDTTALAYCLYFSPDGSAIQMTAGVAQLLGGNTSTPCNSTSNACYFQYQSDGAFVAGTSTSYPTFGYQNTVFDAASTTAAASTVVSSAAAATMTVDAANGQVVASSAVNAPPAVTSSAVNP